MASTLLPAFDGLELSSSCRNWKLKFPPALTHVHNGQTVLSLVRFVIKVLVVRVGLSALLKCFLIVSVLQPKERSIKCTLPKIWPLVVLTLLCVVVAMGAMVVPHFKPWTICGAMVSQLVVFMEINRLVSLTQWNHVNIMFLATDHLVPVMDQLRNARKNVFQVWYQSWD